MPPRRRQRQILDLLRSLGLDPPDPAPGLTDPSASPETDLAPIEEALTHSSAGLRQNHERLEFLGDAVLRLAAAEFLQRHHPRLSVGACSALRAQIVSDRWLAELAETCHLAEALRLGPAAARDRIGRATVLAECCEALVGGIYEAWGGARGGLEAVHIWLDPHWQAATAELLADPHRHNWKSALQEWSQGRGLGLPRYRCREVSRAHGDPRRFHCEVALAPSEDIRGEGWGGSRRDAEQQAARHALEALHAAVPSSPGPGRGGA